MLSEYTKENVYKENVFIENVYNVYTPTTIDKIDDKTPKSDK